MSKLVRILRGLFPKPHLSLAEELGVEYLGGGMYLVGPSFPLRDPEPKGTPEEELYKAIKHYREY